MKNLTQEELTEKIKLLKEVNDLREIDRRKAIQSLNYAKAIRIEEEMIADSYNIKMLIQEENHKLTKEQKKLLSEIHGYEDKITKEKEKQNKKAKIRNNLAQALTKHLSSGWKYLVESDKAIRKTTLSLGMSSTKAIELRQTFQESARDVAYLGGSLSDIQAIMSGFADETGLARVLTSEMVKDIEEIAYGTGLGVEEATQLGARFQYMGVSVSRAKEMVQDIVDSAERQGINTTKALKTINTNFKKLSTHSFRRGTKAFREMAESAELTRVRMETALDVAEATRNLESVIELGANLQVMGGEFAKMDPLSWLYMARNEPEKIQEQIGKMTAGLYTFRKNSEGLFEKFISPADRDRLANVAKSLGMTNEEMFETAQRQADMGLMAKQLAGTGLSKDMKEIIKGRAFFNDKTGKFQVKLGGTMKDIAELTIEQAKAFNQEQKLLADRAVAAQDFDTALKATIEEFKSVLLPMLNGVNKTFEWIRSWTSKITDLIGGGKNTKAWTALGGFAVSIALLKSTFTLFNLGVNKLVSGIGGSFSRIGGTKAIASTNMNASQMLAQGKASMYAGKGAGMRSLGAGAGVGAAGLGIGAGVGLAAKGISELAKAMSGLNKDQAEALSSIVSSLKWVAGFGAGASIAIALIAKTSSTVAPALAKLSLPLLGIGAAVGIATAGIGYMAVGLSKMMDSAIDSKGYIASLAGEIGLLSLSMLGFGATGFLGITALHSLLKSINKYSSGVKLVGDSFREINTLLSGSKEDFTKIESMVKSISSAGDKKNNPINELITLLKSPLSVKFDSKEVIIRNNVSLSIDKKKFTSDVIHVPTLMDLIYSEQHNKPI